MREYALPLKTIDKINFIKEQYNKMINNNNVEVLASEGKTFVALNYKLRNNSRYYESPKYRVEDDDRNYMYSIINDAKNKHDIETLKDILTEEGNEILDILTHNDFKLMPLKITTPMKEKTFEVWDVDKQKVERDRKKKIVKPKTRKPVKKCRCKNE